MDPDLETALLAKVNAALAALARNDKASAKTAMNDLKALVSQVEAQTGNKIDAATATEIIADASQIIAALAG